MKSYSLFLSKQYSAGDTFTFLGKLKQQKINYKGSFMCSFDAKSLFTNVPVAKTIDFIVEKVGDAAISFDKQTLKELLEMACCECPFLFNDKVFIQVDGMAMGSPLSCLMADFALEMIECQIETLTEAKPLFHCRYVDDMFDIFQNERESDKFLQFLNSKFAELQFTVEKEENKKLAFLDVEIERQADGFATGWKIKQTNTGLYLPFASFDFIRYKKSVPQALFNRSFRICSSYQAVTTAFDWIFKTLSANGYPMKLLRSIANDQFLVEKERKKKVEMSSVVFWKLPYCGSTKKLWKSLKVLNSSVNFPAFPIFQSVKTSMFFKNKCSIPFCLLSNVVYKYHCDNCNKLYIGQTSRHLGKRISEHVSGHLKTDVFTHEHPLNKENFQCVIKHKKPWLAESFVISELRKEGSTLMNTQLNASNALLSFE